MEVGAIVDRVPTVSIVDPDDATPFETAIRRLHEYQWVVVTSANGVDRLVAAVGPQGPAYDALRRLRVAAVGPATTAALRVFGIEPEVVPTVHRGEALADALIAADPSLSGRRVLLARAAGARQVLPQRLREAGAVVDDVSVYATRPDTSSAATLRALVREGGLHWVTFTASSTVRAYVDMVGAITGGARVAVIGPITAETVREVGLPKPVVAQTATAAGLVSAIVHEVAA